MGLSYKIKAPARPYSSYLPASLTLSPGHYRSAKLGLPFGYRCSGRRVVWYNREGGGADIGWKL
jgi:hypothetical protein